ncbi:Vacuolar transporter chaperone 2 [Neolecta irregularis DAH-3]|uniref:Vacuolar transporter chaperone 2 n=1 Tax=Neolecta irregularis (strain DAH-3) TaxID=1198029 RepID=A0A1U7LND9_NEOID|nr:Vacuolar transporter chaperone 2 [Neolecta irregularis DAH-3]|eukprot:OLL24041.1 Vacuolar transporter chaperone 2 [Neolecta irregularis DAH-3]
MSPSSPRSNPQTPQPSVDSSADNAIPSSSRNGVCMIPSKKSTLSLSGLLSKRSIAEIPLPPGIRRPSILAKNQGPVRVETKVWLANERTFLKWMHMATLLATLSLGLLNGSGEENRTGRTFGMVYTCIAVSCACWGYFKYRLRARLIAERSASHMDDICGPVIVCLALVFAMVLNFWYKV